MKEAHVSTNKYDELSICLPIYSLAIHLYTSSFFQKLMYLRISTHLSLSLGHSPSIYLVPRLSGMSLGTLAVGNRLSQQKALNFYRKQGCHIHT